MTGTAGGAGFTGEASPTTCCMSPSTIATISTPSGATRWLSTMASAPSASRTSLRASRLVAATNLRAVVRTSVCWEFKRVLQWRQ